MQASDFKRFNAVMTGMAEMFNRETSDALFDAYWLALRDWSLQDFERAAGHLLQHAKFMPRPVDFTELRKAGEPTAGEAWEVVMAGCQTYGAASRPGPETRVGRAVAAVGGWDAIRRADVETSLPHIQRRFLDHYEELSDVDPVREQLPHIAAKGELAALRDPRKGMQALTVAASPVANLLGDAPKHAEVILCPDERKTVAVQDRLPLPGASEPRPAIKPVDDSEDRKREKVQRLQALGTLDDETIAKAAGVSLEFVRAQVAA